MVAVSFGSYAVSLFFGENGWSGWDNVFASLLLVAMTVVNMVGATFVSHVASVMVVVLLCVFAVFIAVTISNIDVHLLAFSGYPPFSKIVSSKVRWASICRRISTCSVTSIVAVSTPVIVPSGSRMGCTEPST